MAGQTWGVRVRVDTTALRNLTSGAEKIATAAAKIGELRTNIEGLLGTLNSHVEKAGAAGAAVVAKVKQEVSSLQQEMKRQAATSATTPSAARGGLPAPERYVIPPAGPSSTRNFLMNYLGIPKDYLDRNLQGMGGRNNPLGGGLPQPRHSGNQRYYESPQMMSITMKAAVDPVVRKLDEIKSVITGGAMGPRPGSEDQIAKAAADSLSSAMTHLATQVTRLSETLVAMETFSRRLVAVAAGSSGGGGGPPLADLGDKELRRVMQARRAYRAQARAGGQVSAEAFLSENLQQAGSRAQSFQLPDIRRPYSMQGRVASAILTGGWDSAQERAKAFFEDERANRVSRQAELNQIKEKQAQKIRANPKFSGKEREDLLRQTLGGYERQIQELDKQWSELSEAQRTSRTAQVVIAQAVKRAVKVGAVTSKQGAYRFFEGDILRALQPYIGEQLEGNPEVMGQLRRSTAQMAGYFLKRQQRRTAARATRDPGSVSLPSPAERESDEDAAEQAKTADYLHVRLKSQVMKRTAKRQQANELVQQMKEARAKVDAAVAERIDKEVAELTENQAREKLESLRIVREQAAGDVRRGRRSSRRASMAPYSGIGTTPPGVAPGTSGGGAGAVGAAGDGGAGGGSDDEGGGRVSPWRRLRDSMQRVMYWGGAGALIYGGMRSFQNGIAIMTEYERQLTNIQKVINPLGSDMKKLSSVAQELGQEYGIGISKVAEAMTIFAQQGRQQADIINQTRTAILATNVTELDLVESTDALTAAQKQFGISANNSMRILDAWNEVENTTAVNARVLVEALKNAGTVAKLAGVDFDTFNGIVAAIGEATRKNGEAIGTSLKFIFQNIRTDEAIDALQEIGIRSVDVAGNYKRFQQVIGELSAKWHTLTDAQKQHVGVSISGVRRLNDFYVMMETWDRALDISTTSLTSQGSAMRENQIAMQSLSKHVEQLKASYEGLWAKLGESGALSLLKDVVDRLRDMVGLLGLLNKGTGGVLGGMMGTVGAVGAIAAPLMWAFPPTMLSEMFGVGARPQSQVALGGAAAD